MMNRLAERFLRTAVSFLPSESVFALRELRDLPRRARGRPHESDYLLLESLDLDGSVMIDVGANRGQSVASFRQVVNSPIIHAFEPNPMLAERIQKKHPDVHVHATALGDSDGSVALYIPAYGHTFWDTRASLDRREAESFLVASNFMWFNDDRSSVSKIEVSIETLDSFDLAPSFVKIDAEGFDTAVVSGAMRTLEAHSPSLLIERPSMLTSQLLDSVGYLPYGFDPGTGELIEGDTSRLNTFFLTRSHMDGHSLRAQTSR